MRRIIDCHCHVAMIGQVNTMADADSLKNCVAGCGYERACIQTITYYKDRNLNRNVHSLMLKAENPDLFYVFGGIIYPKPGDYGNCDFVNEARELLELGMDGLKLYAKPTVTGDFKLALDAQQFDELFRFCEDNDFPILYHVGDPSTFWDLETIPDWAMNAGWYYGSGDYPSYDLQNSYVENFLFKHPKLKIIFAHFFFMADNLPKLDLMMQKYPNMRIDITPGSELYYHLSKYPVESREFFIKYADRIFYGTDSMGDGVHPAQAFEWRQVLRDNIRRFLESDDEYMWFGNHFPVHGLNLPEHVLNKIYFENFLDFAGREIRELNHVKTLAACDKWYRLATASPNTLEINLQEFRFCIQRIKESMNI